MSRPSIYAYSPEDGPDDGAFEDTQLSDVCATGMHVVCTWGDDDCQCECHAEDGDFA